MPEVTTTRSASIRTRPAGSADEGFFKIRFETKNAAARRRGYDSLDFTPARRFFLPALIYSMPTDGD